MCEVCNVLARILMSQELHETVRMRSRVRRYLGQPDAATCVAAGRFGSGHALQRLQSRSNPSVAETLVRHASSHRLRSLVHVRDERRLEVVLRPSAGQTDFFLMEEGAPKAGNAVGIARKGRPSDPSRRCPSTRLYSSSTSSCRRPLELILARRRPGLWYACIDLGSWLTPGRARHGGRL